MNLYDPQHKKLVQLQHHPLQKIALLAMLAGIALLIICLPDTTVEARYQLEDRIGFVVTIPAAPN